MPDSEKSTLKNEDRLSSAGSSFVEPKETKILIEWKSPSRPFKKRDRDYFTTIGAMVFLIVVILFFIKEWLLIGAILSFTFLVYILNTIPPEEVDHKITNKNITSADHIYEYKDLGQFWFVQKFGHPVLIIQTKKRFPARLLILLNGIEEKKIRETLSPYLSYKENPEKTWMDNAAEWLSKKVPLEKNV